MSTSVQGPQPVSGWHHQIPTADHPASKNRYHLYAALFCPYAHRVLLTRRLKGLEEFLPMDIVRAFPKGTEGFRFPQTNEEYLGSTVDSLHNSQFLHELYFRSPPTYGEYKGKYSVPVLWDRVSSVIVNNESEEISRMLNTCFNEYIDDDAKKKLDFYPEHLRKEIDDINTWLVPHLNQGVYEAGLAPSQEAYEKNARLVYEHLDRLEGILAKHGSPFVLGNTLTEIDFKAYATLIRYDVAYAQLFRLTRSIRHCYPCLHRYMKNLYWNIPGFRETTNFKHIKEGYFRCFDQINPSLLVPLGPEPDVEPWTKEDEAWRKTWKLGA